MTSLIRTLIVDDDVATRIGVATILSSDPQIEIVGQTDNASDALMMAAQLSPDVIVVDEQLPGIDGVELIRRLRVDDVGPRVIVLTTFAEHDLLFRSMRAGASGVMRKRASAEEFIHAVKVVARGDDLAMPDDTLGLLAGVGSPATPRIPFFDPPLTAREAELLTLVARGLSNQEISDALYVSLETVRTHLKHVYVKCGARDRARAVIAAYESGMVRPFDSSLERFPHVITTSHDTGDAQANAFGREAWDCPRSGAGGRLVARCGTPERAEDSPAGGGVRLRCCGDDGCMFVKALVMWVLLALAIGVTAAIVPGIDVDDGFWTLMVVALVLSLINVTIGTILRILTIPLQVITFGLVSVLINVAVLALSAWLTDALSIDGFFPALVAALLIGVIGALLQWIELRFMGDERTSASSI